MRMASTYIGGAALKSKLLDEAVNFVLAAGNLGSMKLIKELSLTPEEDGMETKYRLQIEGLTYPMDDDIYSKTLDSISKLWIPSVVGSYTIPVINLLPDNNFEIPIGKCVFCDLIALQKITRLAKTCTTIFMEIDAKSIEIRGCNFHYSLGTIRRKWEKDAIILRQVEKMYK